MTEPTTIKGTLFLWTETGTESGSWSLQDIRFIKASTVNSHDERWDYDGLIVLRNGDHLKIINPDSSTYWEGVVNLKPYPVFTEEANGFWIHADQNGLTREFWALPFFEEWKGELTREVKPQ